MEMKDVKKKYLEEMDIEAGQSSMSDGEGGDDDEEGDEGRGRGGDGDGGGGDKHNDKRSNGNKEGDGTPTTTTTTTPQGVDNNKDQLNNKLPPSPPPLRLGEGKLTGPMRFITCYASTFTFLIMTVIIVGLLLISPPFNVEPAVRGGDASLSNNTSNTTAVSATTTVPHAALLVMTSVFPSDTGTPAFSSDFNQAQDS
ncbi:hypothetical protein Pmani_015160 [Petrolisthes manimaculis]|uniref:Uncharacterized protein n=1 Tax=Petrolisthes manimaculis TaxID=1843537 RepID=A0AAE1PS63_9EUCA|nr:hypothetical protein Pmani_015160 [Petrolisthes manimaculis]